jgi:hypothetical protein
MTVELERWLVTAAAAISDWEQSYGDYHVHESVQVSD